VRVLTASLRATAPSEASPSAIAEASASRNDSSGPGIGRAVASTRSAWLRSRSASRGSARTSGAVASASVKVISSTGAPKSMRSVPKASARTRWSAGAGRLKATLSGMTGRPVASRARRGGAEADGQGAVVRQVEALLGRGDQAVKRLCRAQRIRQRRTIGEQVVPGGEGAERCGGGDGQTGARPGSRPGQQVPQPRQRVQGYPVQFARQRCVVGTGDGGQPVGGDSGGSGGVADQPGQVGGGSPVQRVRRCRAAAGRHLRDRIDTAVHGAC
jgi:hypothetical protein